jgi:hypothetical protein
MISDAAIILANMRGGYAQVGAKVHTLFRMSRRPVQQADRLKNSSTSDLGETSESILARLQSSR